MKHGGFHGYAIKAINPTVKANSPGNMIWLGPKDKYAKAVHGKAKATSSAKG